MYKRQTLHKYDCKLALQLFHPEYDVPGVGRMIIEAGIARQAAAKAQAEGNAEEAKRQMEECDRLRPPNRFLHGFRP